MAHGPQLDNPLPIFEGAYYDNSPPVPPSSIINNHSQRIHHPLGYLKDYICNNISLPINFP